MSQTRIHSLTESVVNVLIGYSIAVFTQIILFPLFGINITYSDNFIIAATFTVISVIRSYTLRRLFNYIGERT